MIMIRSDNVSFYCVFVLIFILVDYFCVYFVCCLLAHITNDDDDDDDDS